MFTFDAEEQVAFMLVVRLYERYKGTEAFVQHGTITACHSTQSWQNIWHLCLYLHLLQWTLREGENETLHCNHSKNIQYSQQIVLQHPLCTRTHARTIFLARAGVSLVGPMTIFYHGSLFEAMLFFNGQMPFLTPTL